MMSSMKAWIIKENGSPDVLAFGEAPLPEPEGDEILLRASAASFNPADASARRGDFGKLVRVTPYRILGLDISGTVEKTGSGVTSFKPGDRVYANLDIKKNGAYAEYAVLKEKDADHVPENISIVDAAAFPLSFLTAWQGLYDLGELKENQRVLINGATGGVGLAAVQLAKLKNAEITAVCSEKSAHLLEPFNLQKIIDYRNDDLRNLPPRSYDLIYNLAPLSTHSFDKLFSLVRTGGKFVSTTGIPEERSDETKRFTLLSEQAKRGRERLRPLTALLRDGRVSLSGITRRPFSDIRKVHEAHESGSIVGKIVFVIDGSQER